MSSPMMNYPFLRFPGFRDKAVTLSYDDGVVYDKKLIEIMQKNGLKGTFNINAGFIAEESGGRRLTAQEAYELYTSSGNEVAVHGYDHMSLALIPSTMVIKDVMEDRIALEKIFGTVVNGMAYANGSFNDEVVEILKQCGIAYARTVISTEEFQIPKDWLRLPATCHHANPKLMELAHRFIEEEGRNFYRKGPRLFYLWGHSYEFNDNDNWHIIEEFAEYIGNREDVWYATNMEIYRYVKLFDNLVFSADGKMVYNPNGVEMYMNYFGKDVLLPAGETVKMA